MPRSCKKVAKRSRSMKKVAKSRRSLKKGGPKIKPNEIRSRFFKCERGCKYVVGPNGYPKCRWCGDIDWDPATQ